MLAEQTLPLCERGTAFGSLRLICLRVGYYVADSVRQHRANNEGLHIRTTTGSLIFRATDACFIRNRNEIVPAEQLTSTGASECSPSVYGNQLILLSGDGVWRWLPCRRRLT